VANLAISAVCNQNCAYCFTSDHLGRGSNGDFMPVSRFEDCLAFLTRSNLGEVRLLGGEPTLHPQFADLVGRARMAGKEVTVFTNGLMPPSALACLEALSPDLCTVVVNVNEPGDASVFEQQLETIRRLADLAMPGFNIYHTDFEPGFLLDLVAETGCQPVIRLGMAQPCLSGLNRYIHPNQYRAVAVKIVKLARQAARSGASLDFDCGFVRCMFAADELEMLRDAGSNAGWRCSPILDVDIEGNVIHCYPLARLMSLPLTSAVDASALRGLFEEKTVAYRQAGVFPECSACAFKASGECTGGCLAATIRRFRRTPFVVKIPEGGEVVA